MDADQDYGDVYVFTLPGFHWSKVSDNTNGKRFEHTCVSVKSTLLSFGGIRIRSAFDDDETWTNRDPFPRGIGIFDMNTLEWRDSYDADAGNYTTSGRIKSWYNEG